MITLHLPVDLAEQFGTTPDVELPAGPLVAAIRSLDATCPGIASRMLEVDGKLRRHLSVFIAGDRLRTSHEPVPDPPDGAEVWILRSISGG